MIARIVTIAVAATLVLGTATIPTVSFAEMLQMQEQPKKDTKKKPAKTLLEKRTAKAEKQQKKRR